MTPPQDAAPTPERRYDEKTYTALSEILRICDVGARLVARGTEWYASDPDNTPGLAAESLIIRIGENVTRVSDACREDHPTVPWHDMKDMRNRLAHYEESTDYQVVWDTLEGDLPALRDLVEEVVRSGLAAEQT